MSERSPIHAPAHRVAPVAVAVLLCLGSVATAQPAAGSMPATVESLRVAALVAGLQQAVRDLHGVPASSEPRPRATRLEPASLTAADVAPLAAPALVPLPLAWLDLPPPAFA